MCWNRYTLPSWLGLHLNPASGLKALDELWVAVIPPTVACKLIFPDLQRDGTAEQG
jgi:hypothetical protein